MATIDSICIDTFDFDGYTAGYLRMSSYLPNYHDEEVSIYMTIESQYYEKEPVICLTRKQAEALAKSIMLMLDMN